MTLPDLGPDDMPDIRTLSHEELQNVPHDLYRWECCVNGCTRHTRIKDYGTLPWVYMRKRWVNLSNRIYYCSKHAPLYRKWLKLPGYNNGYFTLPEGHKVGPGINHIQKIKSC